VNSPQHPTHAPLFSGGAQHRGFAAILLFTILFPLTPTAPAANLTQLQSLISQLGSDDPRLREIALGDLMDLKRSDLPLLRAAALSQSPLLPGQIAGLRDVVVQVFLAGENFTVDPNDPRAFLGIQFMIDPEGEGVRVVDRIQGFPAYRYLQSGDVIVRLIDRPGLRIHTQDDFLDAIMLFGPGEALRLAILRNGRSLTVSVPLDFRPVAITNSPADEDWIQARRQRAEAYWNQQFSIVDPDAAPSTGQVSTSQEP